MVTQYNSVIRITKIDECLRSKQKVYGLPELKAVIREHLDSYDKKISVSDRTIYNDLKFLKDEFGPFGAPIARTNDKGYHYTEASFSIFNPLRDKSNVKKIQSSLSALRQVAKMKGFEDLRDIVTRIEASYNFDQEQPIQPIVYLEEGLNIAAQKQIEPLKDSIKKKQTLSITYQPFDKAPYARIVSPYFIKEYNNRWFLFGHQHPIKIGDYEGITNIPLDRIIDLKPSFKVFVEHKDLDIKNYLKDVVGVSVPNQEVLTIRFKVYGNRRHYVKTKKIHHSQMTIKMSATFGLFSLSVIPNNELYSKLLSFGGDLEKTRMYRDYI